VGTAGFPRVALKLSSAFGGANAALVLTRGASAGTERAPREAFVTRAVYVSTEPHPPELAARLAVSVDRLARADSLTRFALAAVAELVRVHGPQRGAGLIVGEALATIETNALFQARIRARGARMAEPRRFPYTSPNAVAGECSMAFGLTGPSFAVGSGLHAGVEALAVAATLVRAGDADAVVVVATDEIGAIAERVLAAPLFANAKARSGAVAALVSAAPRAGSRRIVRAMLARGRGQPDSPLLAGHLALLPLLTGAPLAAVEAASPPDGYARVELDARETSWQPQPEEAPRA
jgi:3-oxoacyl-[acyl-carrier-protein] synthase II